MHGRYRARGMSDAPTPTWINADTGEVFEGECPNCADLDILVTAMERERRSDRIARAKAEKAVERDQVAKRDGAMWQRILAKWEETFPEKRITSKGIKSERATVFFLRLEAGATIEHVELAVAAARKWPCVVYGKRQQTGSRSDLAIDLIQICKGDAQFDFLVERGTELAAEKEPLF